MISQIFNFTFRLFVQQISTKNVQKGTFGAKIGKFEVESGLDTRLFELAGYPLIEDLVEKMFQLKWPTLIEAT